MLRFFLILVFLVPPVAAMSCPAAAPAAATRMVPDPERPDHGILTMAMLSQVNILRCEAGLSPLVAEFGLIEVAARHSQWQALRQVLSHVSEVPGQSTLADRLRASRVRYSVGAENLGYISGCNRSYLEIANAMVGWWRDSAAHRANMLNGDFARAGAGIAFSSGCARAYLTLDLVD